MRITIAGGGTGGHVIPALAIAQQLKERYAAEIMFVGTARGIETRLVPQAGFPLKLVEVGALKNVSLKSRLGTAMKLPLAVREADRILREFGAEAVVGVGGYASGPAMMAAVLRRVPTLAFEPNLAPGFANRIVARWVSAAAVQFAETAKLFRNARVTGVPVREAFFKIPAKALDNQKPCLLIFGGSQGAHAINKAMIESAGELSARLPGLRIVHQTGERDYNDAVAAYSQMGVPAVVHKFIADMPGFFAEADAIVCRSGASTVAEVAAAGKPAVFIPFPRAADDHQKRNAEAFARAGAAIMLEEASLSKRSLVSALVDLFSNQTKVQSMADAARSLAHPAAAAEVAAMAAQLVTGRN